jgi:hypothetical protein
LTTFDIFFDFLNAHTLQLGFLDLIMKRRINFKVSKKSLLNDFANSADVGLGPILEDGP